MKPSKAIFLIVGSLIWLLQDLNGIIFRHVNYGKYETWTSLILSVVFLSIPIGFVLLAYAFLKPDPVLRKKVALGNAVISLLWLGTILYYTIDGFDSRYYGDEPLKYILLHTYFIHIILILVFWFVLGFGKMRKAGGWLLAGGLNFAFGMFFEKLFNTYIHGYGYEDTNWGFFNFCMGIVSIVFPVSMVVFAVSMLKGETPVVSAFKREEPQQGGDEEILDLMSAQDNIATEAAATNAGIPRVIDWISDFLMLLIPLFGFVFLIWRGQNKKDRHRRNWALASLFWSTLGLAFYLFMYYPLLEYIDRDGIVFLVLVCIIVGLFIFWGIALNKVRNDDFDDQINEEDVPSPLTWTGWTFVAGIPLVGLVLLIVWAVDNENIVRKNWAIAKLIFIGVMLMYYFHLYKWFAITIGDLTSLVYQF